MENTLIIGIGASAGGLNSLLKLFANVPERPGLSFVIVQHIKRDVHSHLPDILSRNSMVEVISITGEEELAPDKIYIMPSGKKVFLENNFIKLIDRPVGEKINESIDFFFTSLANEKKEKAVGVILSGTGTDGLKGVKAIEDNNGIVLVQDPATADFDALPNNIIHLDHPDFVVPPENMYQVIDDYAKLNLNI